MNGRQERERHKAQLLRQIQQQRLELSACRRHWHEATAPLDRGWHTLLSLRSWLMVGSGLMAVWSVRHPHFLMRWTKRGLGLWSTAHGARDPAPVGSSLAALSVGAFRRPRSAISPVPYCTLFAATCAFSVARPSLRRPLPHAIPGTGGGPSRSVRFRLRVLIAQKL